MREAGSEASAASGNAQVTACAAAAQARVRGGRKFGGGFECRKPACCGKSWPGETAAAFSIGPDASSADAQAEQHPLAQAILLQCPQQLMLRCSGDREGNALAKEVTVAVDLCTTAATVPW
jgi:hypothetical protein